MTTEQTLIEATAIDLVAELNKRGYTVRVKDRLVEPIPSPLWNLKTEELVSALRGRGFTVTKKS